MVQETFDVIILGAGAAGLMAAQTAGQRGRRVLLLDHAKKAGEKIRISGGGRCNFTHLDMPPQAFISQNSNFHRSALAQFTPWDIVALLAKHGLSWEEKTEGQLFCQQGGEAVVDMLLQEIFAANVTLKLETQIFEVQKSDHFSVRTNRGMFHSESLIIATGGLSIPPMGATGLGYQIAEQFGLGVQTCAPALVPLTWHAEDAAKFSELAGVSMLARVRAECGMRFQDDMLFTHKGLSGPVILQVSSYWRAGEWLEFDLLPNKNFAAELEHFSQDKRQIANALAEFFPKRFAEIMLDLHHIPRHAQQLKRAQIETLAQHLHHFRLLPNGTSGYKKAEVTRGGVDTRALSSKSMMVKAIPGLFFVGEVLDVTGWLGGYNLQWAWSSGFVAGKNA